MNDALTNAHRQLTDAVANLVTGADWQAMLTMAARLPAYSPNNVLLILTQRPDATKIAGYRTWQQLGRQVRKGERGIAVLAPCSYPRPTEDLADPPAGADPAAPARILRGFRVARIFDIAQTDGDPVPDVAPRLLAGDDPAHLFAHLTGHVEKAGFAVRRADCRPANGITNYTARTVTVRPDVSPAQAAKTLAHELGHILLHDGTEYAAGCRGRAEIEAESVAYLICHTAGLDTGAYTFAYIAHWSGGDPATAQATAARAVDAARRVLTAARFTGPGDEVTAA